MQDGTAVIIIDTGFSRQSLDGKPKILAVKDLSTGFTALGAPFLSGGELEGFAGDPLNHGSLVLEVLHELNPELPVILVRAYSDDVRLIRTVFDNGSVVSDGWTEAYKWAVELATERGYSTVTNCSFGGYTHAMDGTGWESYCLGQFTGVGSPGHIVVAGAGQGDGRNIHASVNTEPGETITITARQNSPTTYNFWNGIGGDSTCGKWNLTVSLNDSEIARYDSEQIPLNFWNQARQLTFRVWGEGEVSLQVSTSASNDENSGGFDCWINHQDSAHFVSHPDGNLVSEPACFPQVIAVGLEKGIYSPDQNSTTAKPEILLSGNGPISFRLPEVVVELAQLLTEDPSLDVSQVLKKLQEK